MLPRISFVKIPSLKFPALADSSARASPSSKEEEALTQVSAEEGEAQTPEEAHCRTL